MGGGEDSGPALRSDPDEPRQEVLSRARNIDLSQRGVNMNMCPQRGVSDSSPPSV